MLDIYNWCIVIVLKKKSETDGKHHMLPGSGDLYLYNVEKSDSRAAYRCRTQHRLHGSGFHQQLSSNAASITVTGNALETLYYVIINNLHLIL